ncbi:MAG: nucleotide exchange factor GrpE [Chlamydiia bacterium]|nr:nucleotide exchange factor GrpE [Chlamydiia bacterium]
MTTESDTEHTEEQVEREPIPVQITDLELESLRREALEFKDKYLRLLAEQENTRKRLMKERDDFSRHSARQILAEFLTPVDQMEAALKFAAEMSEEVKHWALGFEMILGQFKDVLTQHGVREMECLGKTYDPHFHHVTETVATSEHPPGTIINVTLKGYMMGDKTLRPANVTVAKELEE